MAKRSEFSKLLKNLSFDADGILISIDPFAATKRNSQQKVRKEKKSITFSKILSKKLPLIESDEQAYQRAASQIAKTHKTDRNLNPNRIKPFVPDANKIAVRIDDKTVIYVLPEKAEAARAKYLEHMQPFDIDTTLNGYTGKTKNSNDKTIRDTSPDSYAKQTADTYTDKGNTADWYEN